MNHAAIRSVSTKTGAWCVVALGASIPISVALDNILIGIIAICWVLCEKRQHLARLVQSSPVVAAALMLFGALFIGTTYGQSDAVVLLKYLDLLFVPIFMSFFYDDAIRRRALFWFGIAAVASIVVSHLGQQNLLSNSTWLYRIPENPSGFKYSITHNIIVALSAFMFALAAIDESSPRRRIFLAALSIIAAHNVIFMVGGRTGYLILAMLFLYFFIVRFGRRYFLVIATCLLIALTTAYGISETFRERIDLGTREAATWQQGAPSDTSVGLRLEWYSTSLKIIAEKPLLGFGTGSFPGIYAKAVEGSGMVATNNPHNEYLLISVQIGLAGLGFMIFLFYKQWQSARQIPGFLYRHLARGLVITFAIGCMFNSLLIDHTEGLLFAWMTSLIFSAAKPSGQPVSAP